MTVLAAVLGIFGTALVCAGIGFLFVRWLVGPNDVNDLQPW